MSEQSSRQIRVGDRVRYHPVIGGPDNGRVYTVFATEYLSGVAENFVAWIKNEHGFAKSGCVAVAALTLATPTPPEIALAGATGEMTVQQVKALRTSIYFIRQGSPPQDIVDRTLAALDTLVVLLCAHANCAAEIAAANESEEAAIETVHRMKARTEAAEARAERLREALLACGSATTIYFAGDKGRCVREIVAKAIAADEAGQGEEE